MTCRRSAFAVAAVALCALVPAGCGDDAAAPEPQGTVDTFAIMSDQFIGYRFFHLDRPELESAGRTAQERIDPNSIMVFLRMNPVMSPPGPYDITNVAVYPDSAGCREWATRGDFGEPFATGFVWRTVNFAIRLDATGELEGIDFGASAGNADILAVRYDVVDADGIVIVRVGDDPREPPWRFMPGSAEPFYFLKLLKAPAADPEPFSGRLEMRNIYSLGGTNLDPSRLTVRIEARHDRADPQLDEHGMPYLRIFGLDRYDGNGDPVADGLADLNRDEVFDLQHGMLVFPKSFDEPFAASPAAYEANVNDPPWVYAGSGFLGSHQAPQLYDPLTPRAELRAYGYFKIVIETYVPPGD